MYRRRRRCRDSPWLESYIDRCPGPPPAGGCEQGLGGAMTSGISRTYMSARKPLNTSLTPSGHGLVRDDVVNVLEGARAGTRPARRAAPDTRSRCAGRAAHVLGKDGVMESPVRRFHGAAHRERRWRCSPTWCARSCSGPTRTRARFGRIPDKMIWFMGGKKNAIPRPCRNRGVANCRKLAVSFSFGRPPDRESANTQNAQGRRSAAGSSGSCCARRSAP